MKIKGADNLPTKKDVWSPTFAKGKIRIAWSQTRGGLSTFVSIEFFVQTVSVCISHSKMGIDLMIENPFFSLLCKHSLFKQINKFFNCFNDSFLQQGQARGNFFIIFKYFFSFF